MKENIQENGIIGIPTRIKIFKQVIPIVEEAMKECSKHVITKAKAFSTSSITILNRESMEPAIRLVKIIDKLQRMETMMMMNGKEKEKIQITLKKIKRREGGSRGRILQEIGETRSENIAKKMMMRMTMKKKEEEGKVTAADMISERLKKNEEEFLEKCYRECSMFSGVVPNCPGIRMTTKEILRINRKEILMLSEGQEYLTHFMTIFSNIFSGIQVEVILPNSKEMHIQLIERTMCGCDGDKRRENPICCSTFSTLMNVIFFNSLMIDNKIEEEEEEERRRRKGEGIFGFPTGNCSRNWKNETMMMTMVIKEFTERIEKMKKEIPTVMTRRENEAMIETGMRMIFEWMTINRQRHPKEFHTNEMCYLHRTLWRMIPRITTVTEICNSENIHELVERMEIMKTEIEEDIIEMTRILTEVAIVDVVSSSSSSTKKKKEKEKGSEIMKKIIKAVLEGARNAMEELEEEEREELMSKSFEISMNEMIQSKMYWQKSTPETMEEDITTISEWVMKTEMMRGKKTKKVAETMISKTKTIVLELRKQCKPDKRPTTLVIERFTSGVLLL